ncbi:GET complex subunit get1 [Exophiala oligosperma]
MLSLLVVVFFIQLVCHLVLTIGSKPINDLLWQIYCRLPLRSSRDIQEQIRLRREVVRLKREMNAVSAQDEFSKWAKIRRQHDKAMAEHDKKGAFVFVNQAAHKRTGLLFLCKKHISQHSLPQYPPQEDHSIRKPQRFDGYVRAVYGSAYNSGMQRHPSSLTRGVGSLGTPSSYLASQGALTEA